MSDAVILVQEEPISCFDIIETIIDGNGLYSFNLEENQQLRSDVDQTVIVKGIRVTIPGKLTNGPISGKPIAPLSELKKITVTLYAGGWQRIHNMPILDWNDVSDTANDAPFRYHPTKFNDIRKIDWKKSYFLYSGGTGGTAGTPYCVMLEVEYVRLNADGTEYKGVNP